MDGDLNAMVQNILQNPEFTALVKEIRTQNGADGEVDTAKVMDKLPEMLAAFGLQNREGKQEPSQGEESSQESQRNAPENPTKASAQNTSGVSDGIPSVLAGFLKPGGQEKRNKLLCALKPYLSPARCSLIDKAINAMQLGEVLGVMQSVQSNPSENGKTV